MSRRTSSAPGEALRATGELAAAAPAPRAAVAATLLRWFWMSVGAACTALPFLDPRLWPLAWFGLVPLFALAPRAPTTRAAVIDALVMGLVVNVIGFHWLVTTIHVFGAFPMPIALFFFGVLSAWGSLPFVLVSLGLRAAGPKAPLVLAPILWTSVEFLFPNLFPWRLGHSQREVVWLLQSGDLAGPFLLSFVMAWFAAALTRLPRLRPLVGPVIAIVALLLYGAWRVAEVDATLARAPEFRVGVVQGNLALGEKREPGSYESNVARYRRLSASLSPPPDLLVWPETVVAWGIPLEATTLKGLDPYPDAPAPLLFGAVAYRELGRREVEWFNSAFLRRRDGSVGGRYDKIILMPFGEFIPLASVFPSLKELSPNTGDFQAGEEPVVMNVSDQARVGALICYEDLLAGHVRRTVAAGATLLVTIANDAWFGDSAALHEHDTLALWRAVENRRYLVRATNTGLTSVIDPAGRSVLTLPTQTATAGAATVHLLTVETLYQRFGDLFGWTLLAVGISLLVYCRRL
ncbi:MAG TPA: apolipoprotein N-acyltransferase [Candidatus Binatia bacterium]